jgi:alpha-beta hydrolase superfamily lysophospholipase
MIHQDGQFAGQEGLRLYWQAWLPEEEVRAAIVLAHGYGEHGGRYGNLVERLVPHGFAVHALDHRGHGRSEGPRGHVARFAQYVADLHALRVRVEEQHRGKPLFVLGHSLGGLIVVRYLLAHSSGLTGAVLSSPALRIAEEPSRFLQGLGRVLSVIAPRTSFQGTVRPHLLSRDASVGRAYTADALVHARASARFFNEFKWAMQNAEERAPEITAPLLILQAADDGLVDPKATEAFAARVGSEIKEFHLYPGLFHEIFNEIERDRVFDDLERWLDGRLAAAA